MRSLIADTNGQATQIATLETLDHSGVNWPNVRSTAYLIHQQFRYDYTGPISDLRQRLVIIPPERHGDQRLVTHRLEVGAQSAEIQRHRDAFGNLVLSVRVEQVAEAIEFTAWIVVERERLAQPTSVSPEVYAHPAFREVSPLVDPDDVLRDAASMLLAEGGDPFALAARINAWVFREMRYAHGVTGVRTPASEAFALRQGVCQDYAHIMLALCRLNGLRARYVSGHLLGEGGTHAWVEVMASDPDEPGSFVARSFDPTHGSEPGLNYVTVAFGGDYGDVAPTSGTYVSRFSGSLSARKRAGLTAVDYFGEPE